MSTSRTHCALLIMVALHAPAMGGPIEGNPLIEIPAGQFVFGPEGDIGKTGAGQVIEGRAFAMNRTEITNAQYRRFVAATGHRPSFYDGHPVLGLDDRPVVGVSFDDAEAFCRHHGLSLPSEQEYERAARGTKGARFPWGDADPDLQQVNGGSAVCCNSDDKDGYAFTAAAGAFDRGASPEGILNLVGNVWEWTRDGYAPYGSPKAAEASKFRVLRGGSWNSDAVHLSTTYRLAYAPDFRFAANGGFRCVRSGP